MSLIENVSSLIVLAGYVLVIERVRG